MITLPEGPDEERMWALFSEGEREVMASLGPASRCLQGLGCGVRWRGAERVVDDPRNQHFRVVCSRSLRRIRCQQLRRWRQRGYGTAVDKEDRRCSCAGVDSSFDNCKLLAACPVFRERVALALIIALRNALLADLRPLNCEIQNVVNAQWISRYLTV
jgi:hypothetical protein